MAHVLARRVGHSSTAIEAFIYRFDYVHGTGNIDESFGFWVLYALPDHPEWTYVRYVVNADPGIAIPQANHQLGDRARAAGFDRRIEGASRRAVLGATIREWR